MFKKIITHLTSILIDYYKLTVLTKSNKSFLLHSSYVCTWHHSPLHLLNIMQDLPHFYRSHPAAEFCPHKIWVSTHFCRFSTLFRTQIFGSARLMTKLSWFSLLLCDFSSTAACITASLSDFSIFPWVYYPLFTLYTLDTTALQFIYCCPQAAINSLNLRCICWKPTVYSTLVPYLLPSDSTNIL